MVAIDQAPLRNKTGSDCTWEMARLERVRAEWTRFEREDVPAFRGWRATNFGPSVSELTKLQTLVRERDALIQAVKIEVAFGGARSHKAAFKIVQERRAAPPPPPREGADEDARRDAASDNEKFWEGQAERFFREYLKVAKGIDPEDLSEQEYAKRFAEFKADMDEEPEPKGAAAKSAQASAPAKPAHLRIKEIYRILVRRLHPDARADANAAATGLWHEVQEAYGHGNLERLEVLLALTDVMSNAVGEHTSLFQMRAVLRELRRSFNETQRNLRAAKKDPAWQFAAGADRELVRTRLARKFESDIADQKTILRELDALIASWEKGGRERKPSKKAYTPHYDDDGVPF